MSRKKYLIQEVPPGDEARIKDTPDFPLGGSTGREEITPAPPGVDVDSLANGGFIQNPEKMLIGELTSPFPREIFDAMIRHEMEKEEAKKPPVMTGPHDLAAVLLGRLAGLDASAEPSQMSFPIRVGPAEAETDYKLTVSLRAENRRTLADVINTAIRAGQQDVLAGPVVLYLYAVQGHDKIKTSENGLPCVELIYIFRLRETTPKQEV